MPCTFTREGNLIHTSMKCTHDGRSHILTSDEGTPGSQVVVDDLVTYYTLTEYYTDAIYSFTIN